MRTPGVGSLLPAEGMPRSQGGKGSLLEGRACWREEWVELLEMGWGDRACGTSKVLHLQVERDPLQGAVRGSA